jgi:hypothetical protein
VIEQFVLDVDAVVLVSGKREIQSAEPVADYVVQIVSVVVVFAAVPIGVPPSSGGRKR